MQRTIATTLTVCRLPHVRSVADESACVGDRVLSARMVLRVGHITRRAPFTTSVRAVHSAAVACSNDSCNEGERR